MRALDIIKYNDELSNAVDNRLEIEYSSKYEVEIRASMIVVIDYIKNKVENTNSIDILYSFENGKIICKTLSFM